MSVAARVTMSAHTGELREIEQRRLRSPG